MYIPKNRVAAGDQKLFSFLREEMDRDGCRFFCGAGLFVVERHDDQTPVSPSYSKSSDPSIACCIPSTSKRSICQFASRRSLDV